MVSAGSLPRVNPDLLVRPRLIALLDRWSPVTVLLAPAGAGKAVLAVQWADHARSAGHDVIWADGEVDPPSAVVAALAARAGLDPGPDDAATLTRLRRALQDRERRLVLVVNNAEPIVAAIGDRLVDIVRDCRQVHLVAGVRRRLDPMAKALLEAETRIIGDRHLQFTTTEVAALAERHGLHLTHDAAESIRAAVGGWPALVRTGLETLPDPEGQEVTEWSPRHVAWFLDVNVVPMLPPPAWAAVRRVAHVEQPAHHAVTAATGPLDEVARTTLEAVGILDPLISSGEPLVRLPPLMREHFRSRYDEAELGALADLHAAVAGAWLTREDPLQALRQAVAGGCWALAAEIAEQHWWTLVGEDPVLLAHLLGQLPAPEVRGLARVELGRQVLLADDPPPVSPTTRARVAEALAWSAPGSAAGPPPPGAVEVLTLLLMHRRRPGGPDTADLVRRLEAALDTVGPAPHVDSEDARRAALVTGTTKLLTGDLVGAEHLLRRTVAGAEGPGREVRDAAGLLAFCAAAQGDHRAVRRWLSTWTAGSRGRRDAGAGPGRARDLAGHVAAATIAVQALDRRVADTEIGWWRRVDARRDDLWPAAVWVESQHALAWGRPAGLRAELSAVRERTDSADGPTWGDLLLGAAEADLCLALGRTSLAARLLADLDPRFGPARLGRARLAHLTGAPEEALLLLEPLFAADPPAGAQRIEAQVLAAWCHHDRGEAEQAAGCLAQAVRTAVPERLLLPFSHVARRVLGAYVDRVPDLAEVLRMLDEAEVRCPYSPTGSAPDVSPREAAVLGCLVRGLSTDDTARELFVSRNTVKSQTSSLYRKLGVRSRAEAVRRAHQLGLVE